MPLVFVDSRYRASGSSTAFTWELSESMLLRAARLKVEQLRVPVLFWTVDKKQLQCLLGRRWQCSSRVVFTARKLFRLFVGSLFLLPCRPQHGPTVFR